MEDIKKAYMKNVPRGKVNPFRVNKKRTSRRNSLGPNMDYLPEIMEHQIQRNKIMTNKRHKTLIENVSNNYVDNSSSPEKLNEEKNYKILEMLTDQKCDSTDNSPVKRNSIRNSL